MLDPEQFKEAIGDKLGLTPDDLADPRRAAEKLGVPSSEAKLIAAMGEVSIDAAISHTVMYAATSGLVAVVEGSETQENAWDLIHNGLHNAIDQALQMLQPDWNSAVEMAQFMAEANGGFDDLEVLTDDEFAEALAEIDPIDPDNPE